ncbi:integrative conjugal element protein [Mycoplasma yeatsii]|uniref:Uncharacterized protein n=1 Tax=Mycoplasma yeatsii TaxID=51365 RepID=A0ABU0NDX7_9MOLU|nr:integrative conjugal element protein [Mycoplasma yeatsii]MDQ0567615.1 hypothetical protein [Mycoplasma yeatsii]
MSKRRNWDSSKDFYENCDEFTKQFWLGADEEYRNSPEYIPGTRIVPDNYDGFEEDLQAWLEEQEELAKQQNK